MTSSAHPSESLAAESWSAPNAAVTVSPGEMLSPTTAQDSAKSTNSPQMRQSLQVFGSTFVTIFLAEIGDKTQLTTLLMSAESQAPWIVFAGASLALISTSLAGVLLGRWLASRVSPRALETAAGCILLSLAVWLVFDIVTAA